MAKEINWNTVLLVLIVGVIGILVFGNGAGSTGDVLTMPPPSYIVKETVTCVFDHSKGEEKCYTDTGKNIFSCKGVGSCNVIVSGKKSEKLTWKSSCGGYAYTIMDGKDEKAVFECVQLPEEIKATSCDGDSVCEVMNLKSRTFSGKGTAYVCANDNGLLFTSNTPCTEEIKKCTDSDVTENIPDGKNYYAIGKTCVGDDCKKDFCINTGIKMPNAYLMEYYCQSKTDRGSVTFNCKYGCADGACLNIETGIK